MKTSIEKRIKIIVGIALSLVVLIGTVTLYYSSAINNNIELVIGADIKQERIGQKIKTAFFDIQSLEREYIYFTRTGYEMDSEKPVLVRMKKKFVVFFDLIKEFKEQRLTKTRLSYVDALEGQLKAYEKVIKAMELEVSSQTEKVNIRPYIAKMAKIREEMDKGINKIQSLGAQSFLSHQQYMEHLISNANRNLVLLITMGLLAGAMIIYVAPQRVTQPIKAYINAVKELRDLKFETRLPVRDQNELTDLGVEINKFIDSFVEFDEMKRKKIQFEKRKFQVLADILNLGVVIISIEGEVLYLNAQMAKFLNLSTESFQKKDFHFVRLPDEMKDLFEDAIQKKEKFENRMIILSYEKTDSDGATHDEAVELLVDAGVVRNYIGDVANVILTFEDISAGADNSIFKRLSFSQVNRV